MVPLSPSFGVALLWLLCIVQSSWRRRFLAFAATVASFANAYANASTAAAGATAAATAAAAAVTAAATSRHHHS
jgi:hypothetical protein